jgi:hypothetical protein
MKEAMLRFPVRRPAWTLAALGLTAALAGCTSVTTVTVPPQTTASTPETSVTEPPRVTTPTILVCQNGISGTVCSDQIPTTTLLPTSAVLPNFVGGTAETALTFLYDGACVFSVNLNGKDAKNQPVEGAAGPEWRVDSQSSPPGTSLPCGSQVNLTATYYPYGWSN